MELTRTLAAGVVIALLAGKGFVANQHETVHEHCTVTSKDRVAKPKGGSDMRVYTTCGTFRVADSIWMGRLDSADLYGQLTPGTTYTITSTGWRIGALSMFGNIKTADVEKP